MSFLYGVIGTLAVLALVTGGGFAGYAIRGKVDKLRRPAPPSVEEKEKRKREDEIAAFETLQSYSVERAYGLVNDRRPFDSNAPEEVIAYDG